MHYALRDCKRLLHYSRRYQSDMRSPNERLRIARENAGFETAVEAARALGVPQSTYIGHENGHRGFPAKRAPAYARKFKVSEEWLLYGKGDGPEPSVLPTVSQLEQMVDAAMREMPIGAPLGQFPRAVASNLHAQLEQYLAAGGLRDSQDEETVPGKAAQLPRPTIQSEPEGSRSS